MRVAKKSSILLEASILFKNQKPSALMQMARGLQNIKKEVDRTNSSASRMGRSFSTALNSSLYLSGKAYTRVFNDMDKRLWGLTKSALKFSAALGAVGVYAGAKGAKELFNATIVPAAAYEVKTATVGAMFGKDHQKQAKDYMDIVQKRSNSSMFAMEDFFDAGKRFIPSSKDTKQLEKMLNLAERLGTLDPVQGMQGGALALQEMFSGDAKSLAMRFELPKKDLNIIKKLSVEKQIIALDRYLENKGASNELLKKIETTTTGQWKKFGNRLKQGFREMGTGALENIKPVLSTLNKWLDGAQFKRFVAFGSQALSEFFKWAAEKAQAVGDYFTRMFDSAEFKKETTFRGKLRVVIEDVSKKFSEWWNNTGKAAMLGTLTDISKTIANALANSSEVIAAAASLGLDMGKAIAQGVWEGISQNKTVMTLLGGAAGFSIAGLPGALVGAVTGFMTSNVAEAIYSPPTQEQLYVRGVANPRNRNKVGTEDTFVRERPLIPEPKGLSATQALSRIVTTGKKETPKAKKHHTGLSRVPYNNYSATLHKDEAVLTAQQNRERQSNQTNSPSIQISFNGAVNIRNDQDIQALAKRLARELQPRLAGGVT